MNILNEITDAESRLRGRVRETPLDFSTALSERTGIDVYLKLEQIQYTGSFKFRGALNKMLSLSAAERARGVIAASSGNHGMAVACAARRLGIRATIFAAGNASPAKLVRIQRLGATLEITGENCLHAEQAARVAATGRNCAYISPYNDPKVIGGQGTIGIELLQQLPELDAVFVSVGGGGLIAGVGAYLKAHKPDIELIGCQPVNSRVMYESIRSGEIIDFPEQPTLSDGTAGGIEPGAVTFALCRELVDDFMLVRETEIREAMRLILQEENWLIEGAAGVAVAAFLKTSTEFRNKHVAIVLCGRNIDFGKVQQIFS